jgi:hypothetical protein
MNWIRYCLLFLVLLGVSGCTTKPPEIIVTKYIPILPPDELLIDCPIVPPPNKSLYMSVSLGDREEMLWDPLIKQYKVLGTCRVRTAGLRQWKADQILIYKDTGSK